MAKLLDHANHWQHWWQYTDPNTKHELVRCAKCDHVWLYWGRIPMNSKDVLELDLEQPILNERPDMPNTTNQPPNRRMRVAEPPAEETYESDLSDSGFVYTEPEVTTITNSQPTNGQTMPKDVGSSQVNVMQAFVEITSTFSRTIADPGNDRFGSVTAGLSVKEMFPGEMSAMDIANIAEGHYIITKEKVLSQLALPFEQDQATGMILEAFPGARTVSRAPVEPPALPDTLHGVPYGNGHPEPAPQAPAQPPAARFGSSPAPQRQQASSGPRSAPSGQWEPAPAPAVLKRELLEYPDAWYWDQNKSSASGPDFISTHFQNDRGYPAGIWIEGSRGPNFTPDELDTLNTMSDTDFCQTRPRTPGNRR